jgi:hypothetical protein
MIDIDLGGVASAGKPLPEGDYKFLIEDGTIVPTKDGKSNNLVLKLTVSSENENGRPQREQLNIQQKTFPFVKAFLCALWNCEDDDITAVHFDVDEESKTVKSINDRALVGAEIGGTIKHSEEGGRTYGNVVAWFPVE